MKTYNTVHILKHKKSGEKEKPIGIFFKLENAIKIKELCLYGAIKNEHIWIETVKTEDELKETEPNTFFVSDLIDYGNTTEIRELTSLYIDRICRKENISIKELGTRLNIPEGTIYKIYQGIQTATTSNFMKIQNEYYKTCV